MVEEGNSCVAVLCEECVGLLTMLPAHWLVSETVWKKVSATSWRECLCGRRKTCRRKASADLPAKSHFKILSEPAFAPWLSFLTTRHRYWRCRATRHRSGTFHRFGLKDGAVEALVEVRPDEGLGNRSREGDGLKGRASASAGAPLQATL